MSPTHLLIRALVTLGLAAVFVVVVLNGINTDENGRSVSLDARPTATTSPSPAPVPTVTVRPTPTSSNPLLAREVNYPLPPGQLCDNPDASPDFAQAVLHGIWGEVIALVYCDGTDLRYVTYIDYDGQIERTYLFEDGVVRVKLYHAGGTVVKREDFDAKGNLVPDGTYVKLPNSRIGPGVTARSPQ